jgi:hypothetical protein
MPRDLRILHCCCMDIIGCLAAKQKAYPSTACRPVNTLVDSISSTGKLNFLT